MKRSKLLSVLLALMFALVLLPAASQTARAAGEEHSGTWNESVSRTINGDITAADGTTLNIASGATLTVNGTINVDGGSGTLTVSGGGKLVVKGADGANAADGADAEGAVGGNGGVGGNGSPGVNGALIVNGAAVDITGGKGGNGGRGGRGYDYGGDGGRGGRGGDGVSGSVTVNDGDVSISGGSGGAGGSGGDGSGGDKGDGGTGGRGGCGVSSEVTVYGGTVIVSGGDGGDGGSGSEGFDSKIDGHGGIGGNGVGGGAALYVGSLTASGGIGGHGGEIVMFDDKYSPGGSGGDGVSGDSTLSGGVIHAVGGSRGEGAGEMDGLLLGYDGSGIGGDGTIELGEDVFLCGGDSADALTVLDAGSGTAHGYTGDRKKVMTNAVYTYRAWDDMHGELTDRTILKSDCTRVTAAAFSAGTAGGWYVATGDVTINSPVSVSGDVHLILLDGALLTVSKGIQAADGSTLNVYAGNTTPAIAGSGRLTAAGGEAAGDSYGIYCGGGINIHGGTVNATGGDSAGNSYGIYCGGGINIHGGTVTAASGTAGIRSCGIWCYDGLTVSGAAAAVEATGGAATGTSGISCGVFCISGGLTVSGEGAAVEAAGGEASGTDGTSCALRCQTNVSVSGAGAKLTAEGKTAGMNSCGVWCMAAVTIDGAGAAVKAGAGESSGDDGFSYGIYCEGGLTVSGEGAAVEAAGGAATGLRGDSGGIKGGDVTVSGEGAAVEATGGAANRTNGISSGLSCGNLTVGAGAEVTADGDTAHTSYGVFSGLGQEFRVTVRAGGTLTANAGDSASDGVSGISYGIFSTNLTVENGGELSARGKDAMNSFGVFCHSEITISGTATVTGGRADRDLSGGLRCKDLTVGAAANDGSGGASAAKLIAAGGEATGSSGISCGIYCESNGSVTVGEGAAVEATGGTATRDSCGIYCTKDTITVTVGAGAQVIAAGYSHAVRGAVVNAIPGAGSEEPDGTGEWSAIPVSAQARALDEAYRRAVFPAYVLTFDANAADAEGTMEPLSLPFDSAATDLPANGFTRTGYVFTGWSTGAEGGAAYADRASVTLSDHLTLYAQWKALYTVRFVNYDGTELQSSEVAEGETPVYSGAKPARPSDSRYDYAFAGWKPEIVPAAENATYTAVFTETARRYDPVFPVTAPEPEPELPFTDVTKDMDIYGDVKYVYDKGIMIGMSETEFGPDTPLSRGMIVTVLYRMEGEPDVEYAGVFSDVPAGMWYSDSVEWAASAGIVLGYGGGIHGVGDDVTREQLATILWRYAKWKGFDVSVGDDTNILSFRDALDTPDWATAAMQWAIGSGVLEGDANGYLNGAVPATRAEIARAIRVFLENAAA